ncbi:MAG: hypothetical protein IJT87_00445 [Ruminiclostridium sp.]|nr:hypothetical protein [Ruminiclostridium sp.]
MESKKIITVKVRLDKKLFRSFAFYDTFVVKKRLVRPALFCVIMAAFAAAALIIGKEQSGLIAGVLLFVGLGLPAVYVLSFLGQVNAQAKKFKLSSEREVYTVALDDEGVTVREPRQPDNVLQLKWPEVTGAYRKRRCIYLYAAQNKAFLLPGGQADVTDDELWEYIRSHRGGHT